MQIAIDIVGQFGSKMTGIQHYVDSLLHALYQAQTPHTFAAFAHHLADREALEAAIQYGGFEWRNHPNAGFQFMNDGFRFLNYRPIATTRGIRKAAHIVDHQVLRRIGNRTYRKRLTRSLGRYDLFHVPAATNLPLFEMHVRRSVVTIFDLTVRHYKETHDPANVALWEEMFNYAKHRCARVIAISEATKQDIIEHLQIPADRIDVTPLAARFATERIEDKTQIQQVLEKWELEQTPFVLYSGTLEPRKNLDTLIRAFARAAKEGRLGQHKLVLAGGHWGRTPLELRLLALDCGLEGRLVLTGYVSNAEMNALMSSCEAFAYISKFEGFGLPPLEAMTCGAPVITSNTSSLPEVVGNAGLLVNPAQVEDVASALHCLLTNPQENSRRRRLSLERAREFSWERTAALTIQSYEAASA